MARMAGYAARDGLAQKLGTQKMKTPYPWFGGKTLVADIVWERFGDVPNYVEPFFGGGAVLLNRPARHTGKVETVNDINAWLCNFWRAVNADPDAVAHYASDPVNEVDLHARGDWLFYRPDALEFVERMKADPEYYDVKSAGWWVWGQCSWIGGGWGREEKRTDVWRQLPHLGRGQGVNRMIQNPENLARGDDITDTTRKAAILQYMLELCERTACVRVCCGDWARVTGPTVTTKHGLTGMFLDPPYTSTDRHKCYEDNSFSVGHDCRAYALAHGDEMRIALCGYEGEHDMPPDWECYAWKANGGYGSKANGRGKANAHRERIWFSPACIKPDLFGG